MAEARPNRHRRWRLALAGTICVLALVGLTGSVGVLGVRSGARLAEVPGTEATGSLAVSLAGGLASSLAGGLGAGPALPAPRPDFPILPALPEIAAVTRVPTGLAALLRDPAPVFYPAPLLDEAAGKKFAEAINLYRRGERETAEALARDLAKPPADPAVRLALEWVAIRANRQGAGFGRLHAFLTAYPNFPMRQWVRRRAELALVTDKKDAIAVRAFFTGAAPEMAAGKLALAQASAEAGRRVEALALARSAWRDHQMSPVLEQQVLATFPEAIAAEDQRFLALKYVFLEDFGEGQRVAQRAGGTLPALVALLSASVRNAAAAKPLIAAAAEPIKADPVFAFAQARLLRVSEQFEDAAKVLIAVSNAPEKIVAPDAWWEERRLHVRKLIEIGKPELAFAVAAGHRGGKPETMSDAAFHAGWVAFRFLADAERALPHFTAAEAAAATRQDKARALYWLGRTQETRGEAAAARAAFAASAQHAHTYYGQLAAERVGISAFPEPVEAAREAAQIFAQSLFGRVVRVLLDHGGREFATPLIYDHAQTIDDPHAIAALGDMLVGYRDPRLVLLVGKTAIARGIAPERHAFRPSNLPPAARKHRSSMPSPGRKARSTPPPSPMPARAG